MEKQKEMPNKPLSSAPIAGGTPVLHSRATTSAKKCQSLAGTNVRLLFVSDYGELRNKMTSYFETQNLSVTFVAEYENIFRDIQELVPSVILLCNPFGPNDVLGMLREIRSFSDLPVIMISAERTDEVDRVLGLELGADDYLTMPFGLRELCARVRALHRRSGIRREQPRRELKSIVHRFCGWELHERNRCLFNPQGTQVSLTKGEYTLLLAFVTAPGRFLSREYLIGATRVNDDVFDRSIDVQVYRLRRKLQLSPDGPSVIQTEPRVGYRFDASVDRIAFR
jgi:two-component system, OmpR family, response regulator